MIGLVFSLLVGILGVAGIVATTLFVRWTGVRKIAPPDHDRPRSTPRPATIILPRQGAAVAQQSDPALAS